VRRRGRRGHALRIGGAFGRRGRGNLGLGLVASLGSLGWGAGWAAAAVTDAVCAAVGPAGAVRAGVPVFRSFSLIFLASPPIRGQRDPEHLFLRRDSHPVHGLGRILIGQGAQKCNP